MEDAELRATLGSIQKKLDETYISAEKTRQYFLWTLVATVVAFVLPILGLIFAIPQLMSAYGTITSF